MHQKGRVKGNSCLAAFELGHQLFPAFYFKLKHQFFLGLGPAGLPTETKPSALLGLLVADSLGRSWDLLSIIYILLLLFLGEPWLYRGQRLSQGNCLGKITTSMQEGGECGCKMKCLCASSSGHMNPERAGSRHESQVGIHNTVYVNRCL